MKMISPTCEEVQPRWLPEHPDVNRSGAFRTLIGYMVITARTVLSNSGLQKLFG